MANNFKHSGKCVTVLLGSGETAVASGKGYKIGSQVGIVLGLTRDGQTVFVGTASAEGDQAVVALEGVYTHAKASGAVTNGQKLYWNDTTKVATTVATGNTFIGFADGAAQSGDATVDVRLFQADASGTAVAAHVAALAGTLTGTVDGTLADVAAVSTSGGNTYSDAAINTAITSVNLQLKELQTTINAHRTALINAGLMAAS